VDVIRFVDSIAASPTVRLDLNDNVTWGVTYDSDFSPPSLKSSWAGTLLADGELLTAAAYANRTINLTLEVKVSTVDAVAEQLQKLWRELNRPTNFLMWQPTGMTHPVFFRTFRSSDTSVTDYPGAGTFRVVEVSVEAEPFAYGLKEALSTVTITNDPAADTNGMYFDVPSPKGDVETPLYLAIDGSVINPPTEGAPQSLIAVRRRGTPADGPFVLQAEAMTLAANSAGGSDSAIAPGTGRMSGSTAALNANPWFETDVSSWTATGGATLAQSTAQTHEGAATMLVTPNGSAAIVEVRSELVSVTAGRSYTAEAWVYPATARTISIAINWYDASLAFISSSLSAFATAANLGHHIGTSGVAPANATVARMAVNIEGTPTASDFVYIDEAPLSTSNYVTVDMDDVDDWATVLSADPFPALAGVDARGTYRVFLRYRYADDGATDSIDVRLRCGCCGASPTELIDNDAVTLVHAGTDITYADLGLVQIPGGYDPVYDGLSGVEIATEGIYVELQAKDNAAIYTGLDIDFLLFVPADDRLLLLRWPVTDDPSPPADMLLDSLAGEVYARNASGQIATLPGAELAGGTPLISPSVDNRVYFVRDVGNETVRGTTSSGDSITATTIIDAFYWPRYLTVRPAT